MLLGYVIFYVPLAVIAILLVLYFQDLGLKLILACIAIWFLGYWLIPDIAELPRDQIFVMPGDTNIRLRTYFAVLESVIAGLMFLVAKVRNWVP